MKEVRESNMITLANAVELASKVIKNVSGEAISNTVNGKLITNNEIKHAVAAKMQACFVANEGVKE